MAGPMQREATTPGTIMTSEMGDELALSCTSIRDAMKRSLFNKKAQRPGSLRDVLKAQRRTFTLTLDEYWHRYEKRDKAMEKDYYSGSYTMKEIGEHFGVHAVTVGRAVRKNRADKIGSDHAIQLIFIILFKNKTCYSCLKPRFPAQNEHCKRISVFAIHGVSTLPLSSAPLSVVQVSFQFPQQTLCFLR